MSRGHQAVSKLRFFVSADIQSDTVEITDAELLSQWRTVLRLQPGSEVVLIGAAGLEAVCVLSELRKTAATLTVLQRRTNDNEPTRTVTLYCALLKRENFEWVAQKAVEAGVSRLVPLLTERTVKLGLKRERLETIMREAAEQSGRGKVPVLSEPITFAEAVREASGADTRYFFDRDGESAKPTDLSAAVDVFIGPEGGWTEAERALAVLQGLRFASLGRRVLRAETAAVIATYLLADQR